MEWDVLRIVTLYGPVWFIVVLIFAIYIRVGLHIYSRIKQFPSTSTGHSSSYGINRIDGSSMTETYHMTPARSPQSEESIVRRQETAIDSFSDTHGFDGRRSSLDTAAKAYLRYAFLFFIALLVTWVVFLPQKSKRNRPLYLANNGLAGTIFGSSSIHTYQSRLSKFRARICRCFGYTAARILELSHLFQYFSGRAQNCCSPHP